MPVSHILSEKGRSVITATAAETVESIAKKLAQNKIGAVVVVGQEGQIAGIVSERDIVRMIAERGAESLTQPVSSIMTTAVKTCREGDSEKDLMTLMTRNRIRHLPVVKNSNLIGMISIGDVVKLRVESVEREAEEMKNYIASAG